MIRWSLKRLFAASPAPRLFKSHSPHRNACQLSCQGWQLLSRAPSPRHTRSHHSFSPIDLVTSLPPCLVPPVVFFGLLVTLWTCKCITLVLFQGRIIYMPFLPPGARRERVQDHIAQCRGAQWWEEALRAEDGTELMIVVTEGRVGVRAAYGEVGDRKRHHVYVLYFQGNASSLPPRLPDLSSIVRLLADRATAGSATATESGKSPQTTTIPLTFVGLSYRGYWASKGRPSESGIKLDAEAALGWAAQQHERLYGPKYDRSEAIPSPIVILWGQSIGCGIATNLAASPPNRLPAGFAAHGLLLETPFVSIRAMLKALYPQKWVPYQYLWPFLWNKLDTLSNLDKIAAAGTRIFILDAGKDELVPTEHAKVLYEKSVTLGLQVERRTVEGVYHQGVLGSALGRRIAADAIVGMVKGIVESRNSKTLDLSSGTLSSRTSSASSAGDDRTREFHG